MSGIARGRDSQVKEQEDCTDNTQGEIKAQHDYLVGALVANKWACEEA